MIFRTSRELMTDEYRIGPLFSCRLYRRANSLMKRRYSANYDKIKFIAKFFKTVFPRLCERRQIPEIRKSRNTLILSSAASCQWYGSSDFATVITKNAFILTDRGGNRKHFFQNEDDPLHFSCTFSSLFV
ncbi:MAG: hypothetical protein DRI57_24520 [Deltaproteobacteria bacterium]|nr:MAG: hypothetical protein DRI57_24520 [Deltaproteobacteria bacterium]